VNYVCGGVWNCFGEEILGRYEGLKVGGYGGFRERLER